MTEAPRGEAYYRLAVILGALTAMGPLAIDMYLPALPAIAREMTTSIASVQVSLAVYFIASGIKSGDKVQMQRYIAMLILFVANCLFWALFEQAGSSLNFFARDFVNSPFHFSLFQSANPLFIIALAPLFAMLWPMLDRKNFNPSIPRKFAIALMGVGLALDRPLRLP